MGGFCGDKFLNSSRDGPLPASPMKGEVLRRGTFAAVATSTTWHPPLYGEGWGGAVLDEVVHVAYPHPSFARAADAAKLRYPPHKGEGEQWHRS